MRNTHTYLTVAMLAAGLMSTAQAENYTTITYEKRSGDRVRKITVGSTLWTGLKASRRRVVGGNEHLKVDTFVSGSDEKTLQALAARIKTRGVIHIGSEGPARLTIKFFDGMMLVMTGPKDSDAWLERLPVYSELTTELLRMESEAMQREAELEYKSTLYKRASFEVLQLSTFSVPSGALPEDTAALNPLRYLQTVVASPGWKDQTLKSPEAMNRLLRSLAGADYRHEAKQLTQALKDCVIATRRDKRFYKRLGIDVEKRGDMKYSEAFTLHDVIEEAAKMGIAETKRGSSALIEVREGPKDKTAVASRIPAGTRLMVAHVLPDGEWVLVGFPKDAPGVELEAVAKRDDGRRLTGGFVKASDLEIQLEPGTRLIGETATADMKGLRGKVVTATKQSEK